MTRMERLEWELREVLDWARVEKAPLRKQELDSIREALAYSPPEPAAGLEPLAKFGALVLDEHRTELGDLDGAWLQAVALDCGLLKQVNVTQECHPEACRCAEYGDFPQLCLRRTIESRALDRSAQKSAGDAS